MAPVNLSKPPITVSLVSGHVREQSVTLEMHCRDQFFEQVIISDEATSEVLYRVVSDYGKSWSFRRSLKTAAGEHVFDLRHYSLDLKNRWVVEDAEKTKLGELEHEKQITRKHSDVNFTLASATSSDAKPVILQMRQKDDNAIATFIYVEGVEVAEIDLIEHNKAAIKDSRGNDRSVWKIRVGPGVDISAVST